MTHQLAQETIDDNVYRMVEIAGHEFLASNGSLYKVRVTDSGEIATTVTERERNNWVHFFKAGVSATTSYIGVDLSDTTNWPHQYTGRIDISALHLQINISAAAVGTVKLGVITRIDGTNADVTWLSSHIFSRSTAGDIHHDQNLAPSQIKMGVDGAGNLTKAVSNDVSEDVSAINTGASLGTAAGGTANPGKGDFIIQITITSGSADFTVDFMYHTEEGT